MNKLFLVEPRAETKDILIGAGQVFQEISRAQVADVAAADPDAVVIVEGVGELPAFPVQETSLKVILLLGENDEAPDIGAALRNHLYVLFRHPFDGESLLEAVREALATAAWSDGLRVLSAKPDWLTLAVRCRRFTAERLLRFVHELMTGIDPDERERIGTAFREIVLNGMEHGAGFDPQQTLHVSYLRTKRFLLYSVRDPGTGFSFEANPASALSNPPDNAVRHLQYRNEHGMRAGGFGLMLTMDLVDELHFNEPGNEAILIKYLS